MSITLDLSVRYRFRPATPSSHVALLTDHFGVGEDTAEHVIADNLRLDLDATDVVFFSGPSGSGKSSLLRAAVGELGRRDATIVAAEDVVLPECPLIDGLGLPFDDALALLTSCGLAEPQVLLRTPRELSDGQRFRYRLAVAVAGLRSLPAGTIRFVSVDEFTATLDRTLARVVAFNLGRLARREGFGVLAATTHEDVADDLAPSVRVRCDLDGTPVVDRQDVKKKRAVGFLCDLEVTTGSRRDWPYFARWHYRGHDIGLSRFVTVLWHADRPVGVCVFTVPPLSLAQRNRFFRRTGRWSRVSIRAMNAQLAHLSRVVLHPAYRGAGIAARFVRVSCRAAPYPWIESLAAMGRLHPFLERAGFVRVGPSRAWRKDRAGHSAIYGVPQKRTDAPQVTRPDEIRRRPRKRLVSAETFAKSLHARPVYFVFDNRESFRSRRERPPT